MIIPTKFDGYGEGGRLTTTRRVYSPGGDSAPPPTTQTAVTDLPDWAKPYAQETLEKSKALTATPYQTYDQARIAGFSPMQMQAQRAAANMGTANQIGTGTGLASAVGMMGLGADYQPGYFENQFRAPGEYQAGQFRMLQAQAPELQRYQMGPAERVRTGSFTDPGMAEQYMSPYIEQAMSPQIREARRASDILGTRQAGEAVKQGAFGGSRAALMDAERRRNEEMQVGDIRARGYQSAYEQAQGLYGTEAQRQLDAQRANQAAGLTTGGQNLAAMLGVQQLGAGQNLQAQLANQQMLQAAQQAREQSRQFGYGQGMTGAQLAAQYGLAGQQLGEQSRQYGAGYGMQGLGTALQAAGQLGNLGQQEFGQQKDIIGLQSQLGGQQQALQQQGLSQAYQDFLNQQNYPYKQLGFMADMVRGLPLGQQSTTQIYQPPGSMMGQLGGIGMGLYGMSRMGGFAEGGEVEEYAEGGDVTSDYNVDNILNRLSDAQLQQARLAAINSRDQMRVQMIDSELAERTSMRSGLGGAFNSLPQGTQNNIVSAASGGIVAFAEGGPTPAEIEAAKKPYVGLPMIVRPRDKEYGESNILERIGSFLVPPTYAADKPAAPEARADKSYDVAESKRLAQPRLQPEPVAKQVAKPAAKPAGNVVSITDAVSQMASKAGVPKEDFMAEYERLKKQILADSSAEMKARRSEVEKSMGGSKKVKEEALGKALAQFGFNWAAAASKPGANLIGSAAAAAPTLGVSMAESAKLAREMDDNDNKLRLNLRQSEMAMRRNDTKELATLVTQKRMLEQAQAQLGMQQAQLAEQSRANRARESLTGQRIASAGSNAPAQMTKIKAGLASKAEAQAAKDFDNPVKAAQLQKQYPSQQAYAKSLFDRMWLNAMPALELEDDED